MEPRAVLFWGGFEISPLVFKDPVVYYIMRPYPEIGTAWQLRDICEALRRAYPPAPPKKRRSWFLPLSLVAYLVIPLAAFTWTAQTYGPVQNSSLVYGQLHLREVGKWYNEQLPDGSHVWAHYRGSLPAKDPGDVKLGDEFLYKGYHWIWMMKSGKAQWIDP